MSVVRVEGISNDFNPSELSQRSQWDKLGVGGYGIVWRAHSRRLGKPVAIKEANSERTSGALLKELKTLCEFSHANIVPVLGAYTKAGKLHIVLEYFEHDLSEIRAVGAVQPLRAMLQIARAVKHIHSMHRLHRDIKRNNILVSASGDVVKLADFGLAREAASPGTSKAGSPKSVFESREYLAPEVKTGVYDTPADIYSLGKLIQSFVRARRQHFVDGVTGRQQLETLGLGATHLVQQNPRERLSGKDLVSFMEGLPCGVVSRPKIRDTSHARQCMEDLAKAFGNMEVKELARGEDWESSTITSELTSLSEEANGEFVQLARLNEKLQSMHEKMGISMKKMTEVIKEKGICLKNCKEYGADLRAVLRKNKKLLISRHEAKQFQFVKKCLTRV